MAGEFLSVRADEMKGGDRFPRATELAHELVAGRLRPGDRAIDATVGNGYDTVFLAERIGPEGRVFGFDLQAEAIASAEHRIAGAGFTDRVELHFCGHESMAGHLPEGESFQAVMFNLGYLPGGDKTSVTRPESTVAAIRVAVELLEPGGILTIVIYTGHEGGQEEAAAVESCCAGLEQERFSVIRYGFLNQRNQPPYLIAVERDGARRSFVAP